MKTTILTATLVLFAAAGSAIAQQAPRAATDDGARWQPWVGCWQLLDEDVKDQFDVSADEVGKADRRPQPERRVSGTQVCVARQGRGVTLTTVVGAQRVLEETIVADATDHPIEEADCRGTKRSEWSGTASRLYTRAEITCAEQPLRKISSLTTMMPGPTWMDVQLIDIAGSKSIRIRKFQRVPETGQARRDFVAPFGGESAWTIADVKEASARLAPETVQAALVELKSGFNLSAKQLLDLDRSGVPDSVIDLMIALSYPKRFVVERAARTSAGSYGGFYDGALGGLWPWIADAYFWPSYYSPFTYRYWGYYDPYYVPNSGYYYIGSPGSPGSTGSTPTASGEGRVVDGRGYTRITTREAEPIRTGSGSGGTNGTMSSGGSSSDGSSGVSSGGYSNGGGGGGGGRTAVPRPPGGN